MSTENWIRPAVERRDNACVVMLSPDRWLDYTQTTQWFSLLLDGPTKTIVPTLMQGNDFPGAYYFDFKGRTETLLWATGPCDWRRLRFEVRVEGDRTVFGLFGHDGAALPAGITVEAVQRPRPCVPTPWEALRVLMDTSFELWPLPTPSGPAPDWRAIATRTLADLAKPECQNAQTGQRGYNSYVVTGHGRGVPSPRLEAFVQLDIALGLARWAKAHGDPAAAAEAAHMVGLTKLFYTPRLGLFENYHPASDFLAAGDTPDHWPPPRPGQKPRRIGNTWYQLHVLEKVFQLAALSGDRELTAMAVRTLDTYRALATDFHYVLPLFMDMANVEGCGGGMDVYAAGILALCLAHAARLEPGRADELLAESATALSVARRFPPGVCVHEPIGLANAVSAADALHRHSADPEHREWRDDFLRLLLMMMYRQPPLTGLFQACGGLLYPAFKENVEVLWAIAQARQAGDAPAALPVRTILEHQFRNNLAYFDGQPPDAIPYEELPTRELPGQRGMLGKEVYGAGQVFDLALIQARGLL